MTRHTSFFYNRLSRIISVLFHPVIMPILGILLLLYAVMPLSLMSVRGKYIILSIVGLTTFLLPILLIPVLYLRNVGDFIKRNERRDRILPLIYSSGLFYMAYYFLHKIQAPYLIQVYIFGATLSVIGTLIISSFWKISLHLTAIGGLTALTVILLIFYRLDVLFYLFIVILISGLTGFARLSLNEHTPAQVYSGFSLGFVLMLVSFFTL